MDLRTLMTSAAIATGLAGMAVDSRADIVAGDNGISVEQSDVATPARGMSMGQVASKFGAPTTKVPAVGKPPISRWDYPGFVVYFEREHVIHTVVSASAEPPANAPASAAPTSSAPIGPTEPATEPSTQASTGDQPTVVTRPAAPSQPVVASQPAAAPAAASQPAEPRATPQPSAAPAAAYPVAEPAAASQLAEPPAVPQPSASPAVVTQPATPTAPADSPPEP